MEPSASCPSIVNNLPFALEALGIVSFKGLEAFPIAISPVDDVSINNPLVDLIYGLLLPFVIVI